MERTIDNYLNFSSIDEILQDARLILESGDIIYCKVLAGIILVAKDSINLSKMLVDLNRTRNDLTRLKINMKKIR